MITEERILLDAGGNPHRSCQHILIIGDVAGAKKARSCPHDAEGVGIDEDNLQRWVCATHAAHYRKFIPKDVVWESIKREATIRALQADDS